MIARQYTQGTSRQELQGHATPLLSVGAGRRLATVAHPDDDGSFVQYIPCERFARIYANRR